MASDQGSKLPPPRPQSHQICFCVACSCSRDGLRITSLHMRLADTLERNKATDCLRHRATACQESMVCKNHRTVRTHRRSNSLSARRILDLYLFVVKERMIFEIEALLLRDRKDRSTLRRKRRAPARMHVRRTD